MVHTDDRCWSSWRRWREAGRKAAVATVVSTWGSSPRPAGSMLIVDEDGEMQGSVSGGCIEGAVIREAQDIMAGAPPKLLEFGVSNEQAWEVAWPAAAASRSMSRRCIEPRRAGALNEARAAKRRVCLVRYLETARRRWSSTAQSPGTVPPEVAEPRETAHAPRPVAGRSDTGRGRAFLQVFNPPLRLLVVGAVHIAQALAPMAALAGYR